MNKNLGIIHISEAKVSSNFPVLFRIRFFISSFCLSVFYLFISASRD